MWSAIQSLWGAQVHDGALRRVQDYLGRWSDFVIPEPYNLVICDPDTHGCLYLGNVMAYMDSDFMHKMGAVITVIDSHSYPLSYFRNKVPQSAAHMYIDCNDNTSADLSQYFNMTYDYIDRFLRQGQDVFVHCAVGKSRSATIVVNYLMHKYNLTLLQALEYLKSRRPIARPNDAFLQQLLNVERKT